ncbi:Sua5/YciO/YrdC/YwlC family protein [Candidatus Parabeggiatoa sp. HSG14]|uniref:Sua5/YciO/YrdC/YwlC family protein n=1 Tax=Candidatus Parabeggiatoa sp. HSG14 TaxID=3055593 RepID=UPI0025A877B5|nr:Sua5/YciO/YrdC/YwlC family protein [Thiotrichales bacterium HSG14]
MTNWHIKQAVGCLTAGGIIAYPTEAVYGLGCDPLNEIAVTRLLALKQRSWQKGLILIAANFAQLVPFLKPLTPMLEKRVFATWPGAVTWLLPAHSVVPHWLRGKSNQLAVRVTAHSQVIALCEQWGGALVSTSANITNRPAAKTTFKVRQAFGNTLDYIVPGQVGRQERPSEIREGLTNTVLRV